MHRFNFHRFHDKTSEDSLFVHAREDLLPGSPEEADLLALLKLAEDSPDIDFTTVPKEDHARRLWEICDNALEDTSGRAEVFLERTPGASELLDRIRLNHLFNYTYEVSDHFIRGSRPSPAKLKQLQSSKGIRSTVNLCKEMEEGDEPLTKPLGLETLHIPIVDNEAPTYAQVAEVLGWLLEDGKWPAYVHCEAGTGRTGVMTACYRIVVDGWDLNQTKTEGDNFGFRTPDQRAFVEDFYAAVRDGQSEVNRALGTLGVLQIPLANGGQAPATTIQACADP
jgi:protein-tyrosine phosphatase